MQSGVTLENSTLLCNALFVNSSAVVKWFFLVYLNRKNVQCAFYLMRWCRKIYLLLNDGIQTENLVLLTRFWCTPVSTECMHLTLKRCDSCSDQSMFYWSLIVQASCID